MVQTLWKRFVLYQNPKYSNVRYNLAIAPWEFIPEISKLKFTQNPVNN